MDSDRSGGLFAAASMFAYGLPGSAGIGPWDPAGLLRGADQDTVFKYREAELAHGRVAMLACAGFLVQEKWHPLLPGINAPALEQIPLVPYWVWGMALAGIGYCEQVRISKGWEKLDRLDSSYTQTTYYGVYPPYAYSTLRPGYYPGDLGFDPLGLAPQDPYEFRIMQEKELAHCRLAMVAAIGFLVQEVVTGTTWSSYSSFFGYPSS